MTEIGIIESRTHDVKGDTVTIDRVVYKVPEFVEPFLARKKDGEQVDYDYDLGMDGTTRTLKKIMPHREGNPQTGKSEKIGKDPKLSTREGVFVLIEGNNLITVHVAGREEHYAIAPPVLSGIKDKLNLPQKISFSFDAAKIIQSVTLWDHLENYVFVPASKLATKDDPINHKQPVTEKPVIDDEEMKVLKEKEKEIAKVRADPTLTDAEKKIISEQKAAEAKAAITRDPATTEKMKKAGFTTEVKESEFKTASELMKKDKSDQKAVLAELLKSGSITITIGGSTSREQYETRKAEVTATIKSSEEYDAVFGLLYAALDKCNDELLKWKRGSF
jgi:hypothetical protein